MSRPKEIVTVNAVVSELRSFEEKCECDIKASWRTAVGSSQLPRRRSSEGVRSKNGTFENENVRCRNMETAEKNEGTRPRPLYRDVLANTSSGHGVALENVFERKYVREIQMEEEQYGEMVSFFRNWNRLLIRHFYGFQIRRARTASDGTV